MRTPFQTRPRRDLARGIASGLVAGLAATWVMTRFQEAVPPDAFARLFGEEPEDRENDTEKADSRPATVEAAEEATTFLFDHELRDEEEEPAGTVVHYAFGAASGAAYGAAAELAPAVTAGAGLPFGVALWLAADEIGVPAAGLSEPPWEHPPSTHAYGLAAHLVYGLTAEIVRRLVRRLT
jgi:uncharacterized membrane protein YagU involved in acid resistance